MAYFDLLVWWSVSISWSALFLIGVSLYLYWDRRKRHAVRSETENRFPAFDFVFVWVLIGLLGLYIVSIYWQSSLIFAVGNVAVEAILIIYVLGHRMK